MPTYGYQCPGCGHEFDKFQKITDDTRAKCPKCGKRAERIISGGAGVVFKGSGFYETDYKRAGKPHAPESGGSSKGGGDAPEGAPKTDRTKDSTGSKSKPAKDD